MQLLTMQGELKRELWSAEDGPHFCMHCSEVLVLPEARRPPRQDAVN